MREGLIRAAQWRAGHTGRVSLRGASPRSRRRRHRETHLTKLVASLLHRRPGSHVVSSAAIEGGKAEGKRTAGHQAAETWPVVRGSGARSGLG